MAEKTRVALFDNLKTIGILCVVIGHFYAYTAPMTESHTFQAILSFIYVFHMPLFFLCSGLFAGKSWYKHHRSPAQKALLYLVLYAIFLLLIVALDIFVLGLPVTINPYVVNSAPWFLLALSVMTLLVPLVGGLKPVPGMILFIAAAVGAGYYISASDTVSILRIFTYLPYFAFGFYVGPNRTLTFVNAVRKKLSVAGTKTLAFVILTAVFVTFWYFHDTGQLKTIMSFSSGLNPFARLMPDNVAFLAVLRIFDYPIVIAINLLLLLIVPMGRSLFTLPGERSFQIYVIHMLFMYVASNLGVFALITWTGWPFILTPIVFGTVLTVILTLPPHINGFIKLLEKGCSRITAKESVD